MEDGCKIAVVGSGYVGLVAAICFAEIGHSVICVDNDERKVEALRGGDSLIGGVRRERRHRFAAGRNGFALG